MTRASDQKRRCDGPDLDVGKATSHEHPISAIAGPMSGSAQQLRSIEEGRLAAPLAPTGLEPGGFRRSRSACGEHSYAATLPLMVRM